MPQLQAPSTSCQFLIAVDHRQRLSPPLPEHYFGNAVSVSATRLPFSTLISASTGMKSNEWNAALADVALTVRDAVMAVDDTYVRRRLALANSLPDVRKLGLSQDPDVDVAYNTWASIGADTEWDIPGVPKNKGQKYVKPESVRRSHHGWQNGGNLVLPRRKDSEVWEVMVQLKEEHMERLLQDEGWMQWVERVIG